MALVTRAPSSSADRVPLSRWVIAIGSLPGARKGEGKLLLVQGVVWELERGVIGDGLGIGLLIALSISENSATDKINRLHTFEMYDGELCIWSTPVSEH
jgi:hypothetical protein